MTIGVESYRAPLLSLRIARWWPVQSGEETFCAADADFL